MLYSRCPFRQITTGSLKSKPERRLQVERRKELSQEKGDSWVKKANKVLLFTVSVSLLALVFGAVGSVIFWAYISFHELSHYLAMRKAGVRVKEVYFVPTGFIIRPEREERNFPSYESMCLYRLMGPVMDLVFACLAVTIFSYTHNPVFLTIAALVVTINLFSLMPIWPFDGGVILISIAFSFSPKLRTLLITLGTVVSMIATTGAFILFVFTLGMIQISRLFIIATIVLYILLLIGWVRLIFRVMAQEKRVKRTPMSKVLVALSTLVYVGLVGVMLLILAGSFWSLDPQSLETLRSLRWPPKWF